MRIFIAMLSLLVFFSVQSMSHSLDLTLVQSMMSNQNELKKTDMHVSSGIAGRLWLWRVRDFWLGPSMGIYATMPLNAGTQAIRIARYLAFGEVGMASGYPFLGDTFHVLPFLEVNAMLGSLLIEKRIIDSRTLNASPFVGASMRVGMSYLFSSTGLSAGYALIVSNDGLFHRLELAFVMRI